MFGFMYDSGRSYRRFLSGGAFVSKRKPMPVTVADVCHNIFWGRNHRAIRLLSICFEIYEALTDY